MARMAATWECVLDSSAVVAYLFDEPGADRVGPMLGKRGAISAVNFAEVLKTILFEAIDPTANLAGAFAALGIAIVHFEAEQAETAASLWGETRGLNLGLEDRACLALALRSGRPVMTADQEWRKLPAGLGITVEVIREVKSTRRPTKG